MVEIITRILEYLNSLFTTYLTKFVGALIILLIGIVIGRVLGKLLKRMLHEFEFDTFIRKTTPIKLSLEEFISHLIEYIVYFSSIVYSLSKIGLVSTVFQFISLIIILFVILSIVLGLKDFIPNILAGIRVQQKENFKEGDIISIQDKDSIIEGKIISLNLLELVLETKKGDVIYIPNSLLTKSLIKKSKHSNKT